MAKQAVTNPPKPGSAEHFAKITASKVPTILGVSPWQSQYELWHMMAGNIPLETVSPSKQKMFDWGHSAELAMADYDSRINPEYEFSAGEVAYTDTGLPFDNLVTVDRVATHRETGHQMIREYKTVNSFDALQKWGKPSEVDAVPANYLAQVIFQRGVSGIHDGAVLVQGMGVPEVHEVLWDQRLYDGIVERCIAWAESLEKDQPPKLDGSTATYRAARALHDDIDKGATLQITESEAVDLVGMKLAIETAESRFNEARSALLERMGTCQYVKVDKQTVMRRQNSAHGVSLIMDKKAVELYG